MSYPALGILAKFFGLSFWHDARNGGIRLVQRLGTVSKKLTSTLLSFPVSGRKF